MLRPQSWTIAMASAVLVFLATPWLTSLGGDNVAALQLAPKKANAKLDANGQDRPQSAAKPRMRRFGRLPDWARQSWFLRRQMDAPWGLAGGHVIDVRTGEIKRNVNIQIEGDRIRSISTKDLPEGMKSIDITGSFVIPGLFDLHAHVIPKTILFPTSKEPEETLQQLLNNGVTTIRLIPFYSESALTWSARVNEGSLAGPTIVPTSSILEKTPQRTSKGFGDPKTARQWVRKEALLGCRWIKVYDSMDADSFAAIVQTAAQYGMKVCGHASMLPPHEASGLGIGTIEHMLSLAYSALAEGVIPPDNLKDLSRALWAWRHVDDKMLHELPQVFKTNGTGWVPTFVVSERIIAAGAHDFRSLSEGDTKTLSQAMRTAAKLAVQLHRNGGLVGIGTDFPVDGVEPGTSVHRELEIIVEFGGATPLEALQMATGSSAAILGFEELLGSVDVGKIANIVVLSANPLESISNTRTITHVVHDGRLNKFQQ